MFDWLVDLIAGIGDSFSSAIHWLWEQISGSIFDIFFKWLYNIIFNAIADFFTMIGNMGTELFDLPWVQAFLKLVTYFGWALFAAGLIVAIFDTAVEYQSMERINIKRQILPFLYGFLAVNLFTIVPVRLYCWCISIQGTLMHDLGTLFAGGQNAASNLGYLASSILKTLEPGSVAHGSFGITGGTLNLFFVIALGYCVVKIFFANIKRGGMLLTQVAVGSLYMFSIPKGNTEVILLQGHSMILNFNS